MKDIERLAWVLGLTLVTAGCAATYSQTWSRPANGLETTLRLDEPSGRFLLETKTILSKGETAGTYAISGDQWTFTVTEVDGKTESPALSCPFTVKRVSDQILGFDPGDLEGRCLVVLLPLSVKGNASLALFERQE